MKAITYDKYGSYDALRLSDVDKPAAKDNEVLVRVRAAGLNPGDCFGVRGSPFVMRIETGLFKPKYGIPGWDLAGQVDAVGSKVTRFHIGEEVFGVGHATCAEYAAVTEDRLAPQPVSLSFEQASALPTAGLAAMHGLRDAGKLRAGQKVLINGASGGVGSFAVQIARSFGAEVTGVCSSSSVEMVRALGADHVIDYSHEDFTQGGPSYDVIFDNVENRSLSDVRRALMPGGTLILNSGTGEQGLAMLVRLAKPLLISPFSRQSLRRYLSVPKHEDLVVLKDLVEAGKLRPIIDRTYPLEETADALAYIETGHAHGKVVVIMNHTSP